MQLSESILVSSALNENKYSKLKTRLKEVIKYTLVIELIGSIFLAIEFVPMYGINKGVWYSIFHSITAFCNAGFDLFGDAGFTIFSNNIYLNIVFIVLMLLGGIGFFVIEDIITCIKRKSILHMQFHTKIVLSTTFVLYLISIILIKIAQPNLTILQILFLSATLRTTGFSTIDMSSVSSLTKLLSSILMMIGGAPGSTSGGFRITTFAVLFLTMKSVLENKSNVIIFYKKIDTNTIKKALTNVFISCMLILVAIIVFVKIQDIGLINILFMCVSAFSATGLSVINVGSLNILAKVLLMILMFIGRVGIISFTSIFVLSKKENKNIDYVTGDLIL
jgi:trk system potassium uptake protein TrkH